MNKLIIIIFLVTILLTISVGLCYAEETQPVTPSEPQVEQAPTEPQLQENNGLRDKLWFLDDAIFNIIMSAMGTLSALAVVLWKIIKTLKEVKGATEDTIGKREELQKLIEEAKEQVKTIAELRNQMVEELSKANGTIGTIKEMCEIAFTKDTEMVLDGRAERITMVGKNETNN